jgi:hypothetical protein
MVAGTARPCCRHSPEPERGEVGIIDAESGDADRMLFPNPVLPPRRDQRYLHTINALDDPGHACSRRLREHGSATSFHTASARSCRQWTSLSPRAHTSVTGSWLFHCPGLGIITAGTVDQATAAATPYRLMPRLLDVLRAETSHATPSRQRAR